MSYVTTDPYEFMAARLAAIEAELADLRRVQPAVGIFDTLPSAPYPGQQVISEDDEMWVADAARVWHRTGRVGAWVDFTPVVYADGGALNLGNDGVIQVGRYTIVNHTCYAQAAVYWGRGGQAGTGVYRLNLPVPKRDTTGFCIGSAILWHQAQPQIKVGHLYHSTGDVDRVHVVVNEGWVNAGGPWTWGDGDRIVWSAMYETAEG